LSVTHAFDATEEHCLGQVAVSCRSMLRFQCSAVSIRFSGSAWSRALALFCT
jgi:hypothetical protein